MPPPGRRDRRRRGSYRRSMNTHIDRSRARRPRAAASPRPTATARARCARSTDVSVGIRRGSSPRSWGRPDRASRRSCTSWRGWMPRPPAARGSATPTSPTLSDLELTILRRRRVGFVFQAFNLVPTLDAIGNILLPFDLDGRRPTRSGARPHRRARRDPRARPRACVTARTSSAAGSSSASRSRARSRPRPTSSSPTSRPATSTRAAAARCSACSPPRAATTASRSRW